MDAVAAAAGRRIKQALLQVVLSEKPSERLPATVDPPVIRRVRLLWRPGPVSQAAEAFIRMAAQWGSGPGGDPNDGGCPSSLDTPAPLSRS